LHFLKGNKTMYTQGNKNVSIHREYLLVRDWGMSTFAQIYAWKKVFENSVFCYVSSSFLQDTQPIFLCPRHSKNGGGALSVTPVRACVRSCVRPCVRPLSKFGVRSITFERLHRFDMLILNIKTQVKFDLGYNTLIFDGVMGLL